MWLEELNYLYHLDLMLDMIKSAKKGSEYVEVLEHYSEGKSGDGKVYLNDDGERVRLTRVDETIESMIENYYNLRVHTDPEPYNKEMASNKKGRIDLDGLCPYNPSHGDELEPPTTGQLRAFWDKKAKPDPNSNDIPSWASRELDDMPIVVEVATKLEKVMAFLVKAGFTYEKLLDFKPTKCGRQA